MSTVPICSQRYLRRLTKQPKLTAIIQSCRFTLFGHTARMDDNHRCQDDPVSLPSGGLEKITRTSPHHVAQHRPTGSEKPPPYAPQSSRFGSEPPSVDDDVDVWCYTILELHAKNNDDSVNSQLIQTCRSHYVGSIKIKVLMSYVKRYDLMMTFVIYTTHQKMVFLLIWQSYRNNLQKDVHYLSLLLLVCMSSTITGQRLHPQSVAEISHHSVLSGNRIRQCETSSGSRHKDTDQCL